MSNGWPNVGRRVEPPYRACCGNGELWTVVKPRERLREERGGADGGQVRYRPSPLGHGRWVSWVR